MGVSRYLKLKNPAITIVGAQPAEGSQIAGIRKWPEAYLPAIYDPKRVDQFESIEQKDAENMARRLAAEEGICAGVSAAGALVAALRGALVDLDCFLGGMMSSRQKKKNTRM
jgi:cysteine synthase B